jgi:ADP-ribosylglycohydrolase
MRGDFPTNFRFLFRITVSYAKFGYKFFEAALTIFKKIIQYTLEEKTMPKEKLIVGAIAGDIIGSVYERHNVKTIDFDLFCRQSTFTDDSVLTLATMDAIINQKNYGEAYQLFGRNYPYRGYGRHFHSWIHSENPEPYNSWGNGSAMRVSPIGWFGNSIEEVMAEAQKSAEVTHNHPEGIKGAQSTAAAIYMARIGKNKNEIKKFIMDTFQYDLERKIDDIRPNYGFDVSCQGSVPEAIIAFLESADFENAIRLAISIGGDSDTIACITGGIAEAYYQTVPENIIENVLNILPNELIKIIEKFSIKYRR